MESEEQFSEPQRQAITALANWLGTSSNLHVLPAEMEATGPLELVWTLENREILAVIERAFPDLGPMGPRQREAFARGRRALKRMQGLRVADVPWKIPALDGIETAVIDVYQEEEALCEAFPICCAGHPLGRPPGDAETEAIAFADCVQLRSGGPRMLVSEIRDSGAGVTVRCEWQDGVTGEPMTQSYRLELLRPVPETEPDLRCGPPEKPSTSGRPGEKIAGRP